jgi:hypothetical protein
MNGNLSAVRFAVENRADVYAFDSGFQKLYPGYYGGVIALIYGKNIKII